MDKVTIEFRTPVLAEKAPEIARRVYFVSPQITGFELIERNGMVGAITVQSTGDLEFEAISAKLNAVIDDEVASQRFVPTKMIWRSPHRRDADDSAFGRLAAAGLVAELGEGQIALGDPLLRLMDYFDQRIQQIVTEEFGAIEYRYPTLIPTTVLADAGYFSSFPQFLMFVTRLHNDIDVYRGFRERYVRPDGLDPAVLEACSGVGYCLPPTMCYHTFGQYRDKTIPADDLHVVTSAGKSFRYESRYWQTLERLWDFTIRETVFIGDRQLVPNARQHLMNIVFALVDELGLAGHCEVASDPFFCDSETSARTWSQRTLELKYELRLDVAPGRTIAVGSFNFHDDFFVKCFNIAREDRQPIVSGCAGFGLERLVYAFLCQYGLDSAMWPEEIARVIRDRLAVA